MKKEKLSDLCNISSGGTPSRSQLEYYGGSIPWAKISDIENAENGILAKTDETITQKGFENIRGKMFPKGTLLFAMYGSIGKTAIAGIDLSTNQAILGIRPKPDAQISLAYLKYWFTKNKQKMINQGRGVALQNLSATIIRNLEIPLPPLDDQKRIAHLLGKVEGMIARRKQHLQQLDELLKSVFLEMFGDHFVQESHKSFGEYIDVLTDYHANGSYEILRDHVELQTTPNFALMVRTTDLENNNFDNGCNYITEEAYEFLSKSKVYGGEIIINKIGSAGRVYLMPFLNRPVSLGMNAFLLRFNEDLNNIYVYHLLTSDFGTKAIQKHVKGAVTKTITKNAIRSIKIPVPPITLQNQFAAIVEKVESLKSRYQSSLTNLENLYGALSQKAFKGELDLSRVPMEEETR